MVKYKHEEIVHNLDAPKEIVPVVNNLLKPKSVVDIGCGLGTFLKVFKDLDVTDVLGVDGNWVDRDKLCEYLQSDEFLEHDLEKDLMLNKKFDLVLSMEVAEHLSENAADIYVKNLVNAGEIILFSAAIPMQGGQNHINEQWLTYWELKFSKYNYVIHDVLRPVFWDNPKVHWWYKQNMVLIAPESYVFSSKMTVNPFKKLVHYDLYLKKSKKVQDLQTKLENIRNAKAGTRFYLSLLIKSIFKKNDA
ncbi:class I SAM-dependent methyltransferase [Xanthomarina gelatinilytica]|uniref:class I SAM-dependent methyltransferase n=1 Tax=Xanthomarina gelatinilytica TaxID=1137281 RepID=UPI003AA80905